MNFEINKIEDKETEFAMPIYNVHSHAWDQELHIDPATRAEADRSRGRPMDLTVDFETFMEEEAVHFAKTFVFGAKAKRTGYWVPDEYIANFVGRAPDKLIGFAACDPTQEGALAELRQGIEELGLQGVKMMPMYAGFLPQDRRFDYLWEYATKHHLPVLLHTGTTFISQAPLECTLPRHLDAVAIRHPQVRIIMAHLGHPYEGECVAVIRKHPHVYADISALHYRPWQLYNSLMLVQEYGVWDKLLFGSDYPFTTVRASIEGLRSLNRMLEGTALPRLDSAAIESLIYRDSLSLLALSAT